MEKTSSREAVAFRLKQKEAEISKHLEALQDEMTSTGSDVKHYLKKNPWVGVAGSVVAGVAIGLLAGKKSKKIRQQEIVDTYIERLIDVAGQRDGSEREVGALLREALREIAPTASPSQPINKSGGLSGKLISIVVEMGLGFAKKSLMNFLEEKAASALDSDLEKGADTDTEN